MAEFLEKTVSNLVRTQFPAFYLEEGEIFVTFVETYFRWLESVSPSRANTWISEGVSSVLVQSGNTAIRGTNSRFNLYFANGNSIAISRASNTEAYEIFTINTVSNSTYLTLTAEPNFSCNNSKYTTVSNTGNPIYITRHFDEIRDIDSTFENFLVYFKEKYLKGLQFVNITNIRRLVKHSLDLYRSKGTERALELLFRIAYGITPSVYYPSQDLFRLSDGKWYVPKYLEVSLNENTPQFVDKQIVGLLSGATAYAESVIRRTIAGKIIDVIYLSEINGTFQTGETINTSDSLFDPVDCPIIIGSLTRISVSNTGVGSDLNVGDLLQVTSDHGEQAKAVVSNTVNTAGVISFTLIDGGYGYSNSVNVVISDKMVTIANVRMTNADSLFYYTTGHGISQPMADINYISANGDFAQDDLIYTYHANNDVKGTGRVLSISLSNTTAGTLRVSVLSGNMEGSQFFTSANALVANQAASNGYWDVSAWGNVIGIDDIYLITVSGANGTFANNERVYQYNSNGVVTGEGITTRAFTTGSGVLYLGNASGLFHNGSPLYDSTNSVAANVVSSQIRVGIKVTGNTFVNTGIPYIYSPNGTANGYVTLVPAGNGASVNMSSNLLYTEYINVCTDILADYSNVALNALTYSFPGNTDANATYGTIADALTFVNTQIGRLQIILSQSGGQSYGDYPIIRVFEDKTRYYRIPNRFIISIANATQDFQIGELVTQSDTGARGLVVNSSANSLTIHRMRFYDTHDWVVTTNSTTTIDGTNTGAVANITMVVSARSEADLGSDAILSAELNTANGAMSEVYVYDSGFGFIDGETVTMTSNTYGGTETLQGTAHVETSGFGEGFYLTQGGFLSANKKLFDGDYWQNYSYEIRSSKTLDKYIKMLKDVVHVAGTKPFGAFYHDAEASVNTIASVNTTARANGYMLDHTLKKNSMYIGLGV